MKTGITSTEPASDLNALKISSMKPGSDLNVFNNKYGAGK